ncbi:MAG: DUF6527 family protein [Dissulfuribacterales bacterium]
MTDRIKHLLLWLLTKLYIVRTPDLTVKNVPDHPLRDNINEANIFVVGGRTYQKWAYLRCPCGCNEIIMLSLAKTRKPNWSVRMDFLNRPTIYPSIWQTSGCRSHFWVQEGAVNWCKNTDETIDINV